MLIVQDTLTRALFLFASIALVFAASLFVIEVVLRYFFNAPTAWSSEFVRYCLVVIVFGALPEITRQKSHIAIEILPENLSDSGNLWLGRINLLVATVVTFVSTWIVSIEALKQFDRGLMTNAAVPIPRYPFTALIAIGLFGAGTYCLRQIFEHKAIK